MTPEEKRRRSTERRRATIIERYGSYKDMLKRRDVGDLILGGYNGGIKKNKNKGFGSWDKERLRKVAKSRQRDGRGRFIQGANRKPSKDSL